MLPVTQSLSVCNLSFFDTYTVISRLNPIVPTAIRIRGKKLNEKLEKLYTPNIEVRPRNRETKEFVPIRQRWVVERTFAWISSFRRLAKDHERRIDSSTTWMFLAVIMRQIRYLNKLKQT